MRDGGRNRGENGGELGETNVRENVKEGQGRELEMKTEMQRKNRAHGLQEAQASRICESQVVQQHERARADGPTSTAAVHAESSQDEACHEQQARECWLF